MEKLLDFMNKYGILIIATMVFIMFFRTCGMNTKADKNKKAVVSEIKVLDSLIHVNAFKIDEIPKDLDKRVMEDLLETNMWNFLELEELADKKGISILELKHNRKLRDEKNVN